jgi:hypothetical protein
MVWKGPCRNPMLGNLSLSNLFASYCLKFFSQLSFALLPSRSMLVPKTEKDEEEESKRRESRYIRMVKAIFKVCKRQNIPLYSSRYSRRDFTLWQHIALVALMQRIRKSYREYTYDFLTKADKLL